MRWFRGERGANRIEGGVKGGTASESSLCCVGKRVFLAAKKEIQAKVFMLYLQYIRILAEEKRNFRFRGCKKGQDDLPLMS